MEQITITREKFRQKIKNHPTDFGYVRWMHENPENVPDKLTQVLEELGQAVVIAEIELELFGKEEKA